MNIKNKKPIKIFLLIDSIIIFINIILFNIFSALPPNENIRFSIYLLCSAIIVLLFFIGYFFIEFIFRELVFEIMTIFWMVGSLLGMICINISLFGENFISLIISIPFIQIFLLTLYIRIFIWKINTAEYKEEIRRKNKIYKILKKIGLIK
ncbi:MAG: hypothetical protein LBK08_01040 [Treponema sp.]|nr:hypothetical protein [Treponema sp.]